MTENEAIKRVEEFGLHHAIGDLPNSALTVKSFEMAIEALREIQQYRAIGTVEECQEARERQRVKKVVISHNSCVKDNGKAFCPNCGLDINGKGMVGHCFRCGQAISWESDTP